MSAASPPLPRCGEGRVGASAQPLGRLAHRAVDRPDCDGVPRPLCERLRPAAPVLPFRRPRPPPSQPGPLPPGPATPRAQLRAGFGGLVDTIEVSAIEPLPLREAALVAPDGTTVPATDINVTDNPSLATGQWSLSNRWDDAAGSDNALAALALPNMQGGRRAVLEPAASGDGVAGRHPAARSGRLSPRLAELARPARLRHAARRAPDLVSPPPEPPPLEAPPPQKRRKSGRQRRSAAAAILTGERRFTGPARASSRRRRPRHSARYCLGS